jgi:hypothetical protein
MVNGDLAGMKTSIESPQSRFEDGVETRKVPQGRLYTGARMPVINDRLAWKPGGQITFL